MTSLSVQQLARNAPCRREYGGCGALPGESCVRTCSGKQFADFPFAKAIAERGVL